MIQVSTRIQATHRYKHACLNATRDFVEARIGIESLSKLGLALKVCWSALVEERRKLQAGSYRSIRNGADRGVRSPSVRQVLPEGQPSPLDQSLACRAYNGLQIPGID